MQVAVAPGKLRRQTLARHGFAHGYGIFPAGSTQQRFDRGQRGVVVQQADPQRGLRQHHLRPPGVGTAHFEELLDADVGEHRGHVVGEIAQRRLGAGQVVQPPVHEVAEPAAGHVDVVAVSIDEIHRHVVHQPGGILLEAESILEHHRRDAGAVVVGVGPDKGAVGLEAVRPALGEGGVGEQCGGQRLQQQPAAQFAHHVGFGGVVEVHLYGTGAGHHVQAARPDQRHVAAHDGVAALRHPRQVLAPGQRMEAERGETDPQVLGDAAHLSEMGLHLGSGVVQRFDRSTRQFELAGGFQRDRRAALLQADDVVVVGDRGAVIAQQPGQQIADRARLAVGGKIGRRGQVVLAEAELLVFRADAPLGRRLATCGDVIRKLADRGDRSRVAVSGIGHAVPRRFGFMDLCSSRTTGPATMPARQRRRSRPAGCGDRGSQALQRDAGAWRQARWV